MKIIVPQPITDAVLTSSSVPETDYSAWSALTAYVVGNRVTVADSGIHRNYECLIGNTNKYPPTYSVTALPEWLDLGADNRWRMFDSRVGNVTSQLTSIAVELTPGRVINSLALFGLAGVTLDVVMTDPTAGVVYSKTVSLIDSPFVVDIYTYWFSEFVEVFEVVLTDLPAYTAAVISITITAGTGGYAECGHTVLGMVRDLGFTQFGATVGIADYSRKDTDAFGNPVIVQRKFAQTASYDVKVNTNRVRGAQKTLADLRTTPVVWIGAAEHPATVVFGWYKGFSLVISSPVLSDCAIDVEEFR